MSQKYKSGDIVPKSSTYNVYDSEGHDCGSLFLEKGKRFPATQHSGNYYIISEYV